LDEIAGGDQEGMGTDPEAHPAFAAEPLSAVAGSLQEGSQLAAITDRQDAAPGALGRYPPLGEKMVLDDLRQEQAAADGDDPPRIAGKETAGAVAHLELGLAAVAQGV
jgi:hypothetical protein